MHQDMLNLIRLLDLNADAHAVYARLDKHSLVLISSDRQGVQKDFGGGLRFDFRDVVPFGGLGCEV
jgi:hypothetical protein